MKVKKVSRIIVFFVISVAVLFFGGFIAAYVQEEFPVFLGRKGEL